MLFHYGNCKNELHYLTQLKVDNEKRIQQLEKEVLDLMGQVQEGKIFFDYQTAILETEVKELKERLDAKTCVGEICRPPAENFCDPLKKAVAAKTKSKKTD